MAPRLARALRLAPTLLAICASAPLPLAAQTIDTIIVVRHNVYDRKRDAPKVVASVGNALHITTLGWVVRHALLIKRGDTYDSAKVAESERALRALTIFRAVSIDTERVDGDRLALRVETDDAWSTIPDFDYSSVAGDVLWAVAFTEGSRLVTGTALTGRYEKTPDRHSVSVGYNSTGVLGRRTVLAGQYKVISDGDSGSWSLGVPFYETVAPRSLTTNGAAGKERVLQFRDGVLADSVQHRLLLFGLSGGVALRATRASYARLWFGASWRREDFDSASAVPFPRSQFGTVGAGREVKQVRFAVLENFNAFAHQEDVDLSQFLRLGVWAAPRAWGDKPDRCGVASEGGGRVRAIWAKGFGVVGGLGGRAVEWPGVAGGRVM